MKRYIIFSIIIVFAALQVGAQSLSLDSCIANALQNNKRIKEAQMNIEASKQVKKDAFTKYFPQVDAGIFIMKANAGLLEIETPEMNLPVYDGNPANIPIATQFTYVPAMQLELIDYANSGFVTAIQPIYMGGRIMNGNKLASLGVDVNELMLNMTVDEVILKTENYYWTIVSLQEKINTLNNYEKLLHSLLKDVTVSFEAGLIQKSDLLKVQMKLSNIDANKLKLDNGISLLKMVLAQHMGTSVNNNFTISDSVVGVSEPLALYQDPQLALANRLEYKLLNKAVDAEVLQKRMARGEMLPKVAVGVQALYFDILENQSTKGLAFATVIVPISGWWGGSHKLKEHQIKVAIAQNNLDEKSELLVLQMNKAFNELNESFMQIKVAEASKDQAVEHFSVVSDNYNAGVVSTSDMLEAQALMQQSLDAVVNAQTNYKIKQSYYLYTIVQKR